MKRYDCYYTNDFGDDYPAFSREQEDGEWVEYEEAAAQIAALQSRLAECERENEELKLAAQYGWKNGEPPRWLDEWFLASTTFGPCVLARLPEEYTYDYKTADETYIKAEHVKRWMQLPNSEFKPMNCERDELRAEVARLHDVIEGQNEKLDVAEAGCEQKEAEVARLTAVVQAGKEMVIFARSGIEQAIYYEDGLDGDTGQGILQIINEWDEHGTFDSGNGDCCTTNERRLEAELAALREACSSALDTLTTGEINVKGRVAAVLRDALGR